MRMRLHIGERRGSQGSTERSGDGWRKGKRSQSDFLNDRPRFSNADREGPGVVQRVGPTKDGP
jgi:hypothetical protein